MRIREAREASLPAPPEALLMFADLSKVGGRGPGMEAYPDRAAWLAARREREARHGMTIAEWATSTLAELSARARSLGEMNEAAELTMHEPDDWQDPRTLTGEQLAAGSDAKVRQSLASLVGTYPAGDAGAPRQP